MAYLRIQNEKTGVAWKVWPEADEALSGAIHETGSYLFELHDVEHASAAELLIDDQPLEALRTVGGIARWRWSPGFHAGMVDAELRLLGSNPRSFEVVTNPDMRKLTRENFDEMVREILQDTFALFALSSFRQGIACGSGKRPPAIARMEFLRSRIDELERVIAAIVRNPRHMLTTEEVALPYHRAMRATGSEILKSFRTSSIRAEQVTPSRLPAALKGFLPSQIRIRKRMNSFDLPEHRQMGACLRAWSAWLAAVSETLTINGGGADTEIRRERLGWSARCRKLSHRLARMAIEAPFAESGEALPRLMLSALFRNDPNYRRFFRLWQDINLGIAAVFGDFLDMPLARTFELYELWCFLRLVRAAIEEYGKEGFETNELFIKDASGGLTIAAGSITVAVGEGWKLCFQKRYQEFWIEPSGCGSFSRIMTPDVAMMQEIPENGKTRLIILDAKYRIEDGLNNALNSIHTYRDALVHEIENGSVESIVGAAYLLTPHVPKPAESYRETPMPSRLFHPEYRNNFRFGAITMRPGMTIDEMREALRVIVADAIG
jgi:hypothetical protein